MKVLVFGYSDNPDRYSNIAANLLKDYKHEVVCFNPRSDEFSSLDKSIDTLTLYVSKPISDKFFDEIISLNFKRIIFNPGSENDLLEKKLRENGIEIVHGCTLVMLKTSQF